MFFISDAPVGLFLEKEAGAPADVRLPTRMPPVRASDPARTSRREAGNDGASSESLLVMRPSFSDESDGDISTLSSGMYRYPVLKLARSNRRYDVRLRKRS